MKSKILIKKMTVAIALLLMFPAVTAFAQAQEKIFYNMMWKACSQSEAMYYYIVNFDSHGKPVGKIYEYYITGELRREMEGALNIDKKDGFKSVYTGLTKGFYKSGAKWVEELMDNQGKLVSSKYWYENGKLMSEWSNNGNSVSYYENGNLKSKGTYKNGKEDGECTEYYANGQLKSKGVYKNGELTGELAEYDETGKLKSKGKMSITLEYDVSVVEIHLHGSGAATIAWGDQWEAETVTLTDDWKMTDHAYSGRTSHTVTITGNVTGLSIADYRLKSIDVSQNPYLTVLDCHGAQLGSLDVSRNTALLALYCFGNMLTNLDLSRNTALLHLYCGGALSYDNSGNHLFNLDVSRNTALQTLDCSYNRLSGLDVSKNTALKILCCAYNGGDYWGNAPFTKLDVSRNTALVELICYNNKIEALDVSRNTALDKLDVEENELTRLNLSQNTALTDVRIYGNKFTTSQLNALYETLHGNMDTKEKWINNGGNPGSVADESIAKKKGWHTNPFGAKGGGILHRTTDK